LNSIALQELQKYIALLLFFSNTQEICVIISLRRMGKYIGEEERNSPPPRLQHTQGPRHTMTQPTHPEPDYQPANKEGDQKRLPKRTEDQMSTVSNLTRNSWRSLAPDEHHKCTHLSRFALPS